MQVQSLGQEDPLEEEMVTHSSILAERIPWTEEPGELQTERKWKSESCSFMSDSLQPHGLYSLRNSPGQNTEAIPFSRGSSQPRDGTQVFHIAGGFFTI